MAKKKLTIKEFAQILGVSTATVSRAFSSKGRISDKTRKHIIAKAEELGYCANIHARSLNTPDSFDDSLILSRTQQRRTRLFCFGNNDGYKQRSRPARQKSAGKPVTTQNS